MLGLVRTGSHPKLRFPIHVALPKPPFPRRLLRPLVSTRAEPPASLPRDATRAPPLAACDSCHYHINQRCSDERLRCGVRIHRGMGRIDCTFNWPQHDETWGPMWSLEPAIRHSLSHTHLSVVVLGPTGLGDSPSGSLWKGPAHQSKSIKTPMAHPIVGERVLLWKKSLGPHREAAAATDLDHGASTPNRPGWAWNPHPVGRCGRSPRDSSGHSRNSSSRKVKREGNTFELRGS